MSKTIAAITDSSTFSVWKQQSNDLASHAAKAVTMTSTGTPGDNNEGNISLNGNLALEAGHTITVDTITGNSTAIELQKNLRIDGVGATSLTFSLSDTPKWILQTSADHGYFEVVRGDRYFRITSDGSSTGAITGSGVTLNKALLPASIDAATTGNAATATLATSFTVTANNSSNETVYPVFVDGATGTQGAETDSGLSYNPSTGLLTSAAFTATGAVTAASLDINGNADVSGNLGVSGTLTANITGNVTGSVSGATNVTASGTITGGTIAGTTYTGLPVSSTTVQGIVELATSTEVKAGIDAVRALTAASLLRVAVSNSQVVSSGDQGSLEIAGVVVKWGHMTSTTGNAETFLFDTAFPNYASVVMLTRLTAGGTSTLNCNSRTKSAFTINRYNDTFGAGDYEFFFLAIGG